MGLQGVGLQGVGLHVEGWSVGGKIVEGCNRGTLDRNGWRQVQSQFSSHACPRLNNGCFAKPSPREDAPTNR